MTARAGWDSRVCQFHPCTAATAELVFRLLVFYLLVFLKAGKERSTRSGLSFSYGFGSLRLKMKKSKDCDCLAHSKAMMISRREYYISIKMLTLSGFEPSPVDTAVQASVSPTEPPRDRRPDSKPHCRRQTQPTKGQGRSWYR